MSWKTNRRPWSIATRLTAWYALTVVGLFAISCLVIEFIVTRDGEPTLLQAIEKGTARVHGNREAYSRIPYYEEDESQLRMISPEGRVVFETSLMAREFAPRVFPEPGYQRDEKLLDGRHFTLFARRHEGWIYQIAINRSDERNVLNLIYRNIVLIALPVVLFAIIAGYLIAHVGMRPLRTVAKLMETVSAERLDRRVPTEEIPGELANVATSFNLVVDRLSRSVAHLDQFAADVAHELRTPVHNLRTAAELALQSDRSTLEYRQVLANVVEEADGLARLIDRLLLLARLSDPRSALVRETTEIALEMSNVRDFFEPAATEAGVEICVEAEPNLRFEVDRALLQRAVSNLVANALTHTTCGGRIDLCVSAKSATLSIEVRDTGRGIPSAALPQLFDRFYRPIGAVGDGVGLGLAIVKRIVELHGGTVSATSEVGHGTTVSLRIPPSKER